MKKFYLMLFTLVATNSLAGGGLPPQKIESVAFHAKGFFLYSKDWNDPNNCTVDGQPNAIVLEKSTANYDKAYTLVLAAYMAGKKVGGYSDGCAEHDGKMYNTIRGFKYLSVH